MTEQMKSKLSNFIDSLIQNKVDKIIIDIWTDKSKKHTYYSIDIDTGTSLTSTNHLITYNLHFAVCPQSGLVLLSKDNYEEFKSYDLDFAKKYTDILLQTKNQILTKNLDIIINTTNKELKLTRDENIKKLIG